MSKAPNSVYLVNDDDIENPGIHTIDEIYALAKATDEKVNNLLAGLKQFLEFAEQMKGHPLLSAFAPQGGKQQRK